MRCWLSTSRSCAPQLALYAVLLLTARSSRAASTYLTVQTQVVTAQLDAYARVEPIATLPVRAALVGVLAGSRVVPGSTVRAGQTLARLAGPEIRALVTREEGAVRRAQAGLRTARRSLGHQRALLALQLAIEQAVADARNAVAAAEAELGDARARLHAAQALQRLRAPTAGVVLAVNAAAGERVAAGETVFTLQANNQLWLRAAYYGADVAAIRVGMRGSFVRAAGSPPVPVRVVSVFGALDAGGGESIGLSAAANVHWQNGESGIVRLDGPPRSLIGIPTQALILDQSRWWVMVATAHGPAPREVVPGPTRGWQTFIDSGLAPGARVLVENAYLEFHRGINQSYQPAD